MTGTIPSIFAKFSLLWTSLIYIFTNKKIKRKLFGKANSDSQETQQNRSNLNEQKNSCNLMILENNNDTSFFKTSINKN